MRLVNMEVDRPGSKQNLRLGQLSPGLNAICGPQGSGKTTLLAWLRYVANESQLSEHIDSAWRERPPMAGAAQFENRGGSYRVISDRNGRIRFDAVPGAGYPVEHIDHERWDGRIEHPAASNLTATQRQAFLGLAAASGVYDTEAALEQLAQRLGVEQNTAPNTYVGTSARQQQIEDQLQRLSSLRLDRETLLARQRQLETELATTGQTLRYTGVGIERERIDRRSEAIELDLQEVLRELEHIDAEIATKEAELQALEIGSTTVTVADSYRHQLQQLDDRLNRWRQTLRDLKSHREAIESNATDARLDEQIGDQLSSSKEADPRAAMRSLEAQIMSTRQQLDTLVDRFTTVPGYDYRSAAAAVSGTGYQPSDVQPTNGVYRDASGRTYLGHAGYLPESTVLPETLRAMQKDLQEVCQQLARHEAKTATETLKQQSQQLKRCETEMLHSVEKLIEERAALLRRIANEHHISIEQLTLAFGDWCQCHDHPHLHEWLLSEESGKPSVTHSHDPAVRQQVLEELEILKQQRKTLSVRADECRRQIRDAQLHRRTTTVRRTESPGRTEGEIRHELQQVTADLAAMAQRDQLESELAELRTQNSRLTSHGNTFREQTNGHITGLMGTTMGTSAVPVAGRRYDFVDGITTTRTAGYEANRLVPPEIVRIAMRLTIVTTLAQRSEPVPLILDGTLDNLAPDLQRCVVNYINTCSASVVSPLVNGDPNGHGFQVVVLTANQHIADLVASYQGWVGYMAPVAKASRDVNDQLSAFANDVEADKWHQPEVQTVYRNEFFLNESSWIEDLPAIDPGISSRCRELGIDRIGDLLDVDSQWLSEQLRIDGVGGRTVTAWQSAASLLCNVRNLRPFDARVLVGAGIQSPSHLADMHPSQLLERVERFLTTTQGRKILKSGNSYELSRITAWIASAKGGEGFERDSTSRTRNGSYRNGSNSRGYRNGSHRNGRRTTSRNGDRVGYDYDGDGIVDFETSRDRYDRDFDNEDREYSYERDRNAGRRSRSSSRSSSRRSSSRSSRGYPVVGREERTERQPKKAWAHESSENGTVRMESETSGLKFYLELASPVVDAPSIGPRMATRLEEHDILTVDQLLVADPEELADKLDHRRVDADVIRAWQEQARLVCRIPNLRGHDAQMLVACDLTSPEDLAAMDAEDVLAQVSVFAQSKEGQRVLRGSKDPDLEEVTDWISWASQCRSLNAA